jgi:hypothetical protein
MGYGWFAPPPGVDDFTDDYDVPEGYWDKGGGKRTPDGEERHRAVIAALKRTLLEFDRDERSS